MKTICMLLALFAVFASTVYAGSQQDTMSLKVNSVTPGNGSKEIRLNEVVVVTVNRLDSLQKLAGNKPIVLFIDGIQLIDCVPLSFNPGKQELAFLLARTDSTEKVWNLLLGRPRCTRSVVVSVGVKNGSPIASDGKITFGILDPLWLWLYITFSAALLVVLFFYMIPKTNLLRDDGPELNGENKKRMFSLARTQMLVWTILVVGSFVFLWAVTGDINTISDSVLILMGISSATALSAKMISDPHAADKPTTGNFLKDILTGSSDNELHRLQIVIWTIVLAIIFITSVYENLAMPEFNGTLLTLMGISSGTYIGFKLNEK